MLTERELDVLLRRAKGESQAKIAKALEISQGAVSQFETNAQRKIASAANTLEFLKTNGVNIVEGQLDKKVVYGGKQ